MDGPESKGPEDLQATATRMLAMMPKGKWAVEHSTLNGMMRDQLLSDLGGVSEQPKAIYKVLKTAGGQLPLRRLLRAQERGLGVSAAATSRQNTGSSLSKHAGSISRRGAGVTKGSSTLSTPSRSSATGR